MKLWRVVRDTTLLLCITQQALAFVPAYVPFEESMGNCYQQCYQAQSGRYLTATAPARAAVLLDFFKQLYEQRHPAKTTPAPTPRIPKVIHQIWLGNPLPEKFKSWQQSWLELHPDWHYILWTDQHVVHNATLAQKYAGRYTEQPMSSLGTLFNQSLYTSATNYGAKADILRVEILSRFGGLYVDVDVQALKPFDHLHHCYDLYAGIESLEFLWLSLNNGVIGSRANHPILVKYMFDMQHCGGIMHLYDTQMKTGPIAFTKAFWACAGKDGNYDIAFPARYFGPIDRFTNITIYPETHALQYFTHSWTPHGQAQIQQGK